MRVVLAQSRVGASKTEPPKTFTRPRGSRTRRTRSGHRRARNTQEHMAVAHEDVPVNTKTRCQDVHARYGAPSGPGAHMKTRKCADRTTRSLRRAPRRF